jgi:transcriptional regulator with XRE-family HTH domain
MSLGAELRKARLAAGLTQEALSSSARIDRSYISQLERDLKSPTVETLLRLCRAMGASASKMIARVEKKE